MFSCYREPLTGRGTDIESYKQINDEEKEEEEAKTVGELDVDDKIARPQSGQVDSRHLCTTLYKYLSLIIPALQQHKMPLFSFFFVVNFAIVLLSSLCHRITFIILGYSNIHRIYY